MAEPWTILSLLNWTTDYFKKNNIDSPRLDAEVLLAHSLKLKRMQLYLQFDKPMLDAELKDYKALIQRRIKREPIAYIIGEKEFWSLPFKVGPGVLVPRPDTEILIEILVNSEWCVVNGKKTLNIVDIGTGSGILAITLAKEFPNAQVTAIDVSAEALNYAKENATTHGVESRIEFVQSDFLSIHQLPSTIYDLIVSNPPYISSSIIDTLEPEVSQHEPKLALDGGSDGLNFYRAIAQYASKHLAPQGMVIVEIGEEQGLSVKQLLIEAGFQNVEVKKDYAGHDRVVMGYSSANSGMCRVQIS